MLLFVRNIDETKAVVEAIHYKPELLTAEQKLNSIEVTSIPEPERNSCCSPVLYINPITKEMHYEYLTIQNERDLQIENLRSEIARLQAQLDSLTN